MKTHQQEQQISLSLLDAPPSSAKKKEKKKKRVSINGRWSFCFVFMTIEALSLNLIDTKTETDLQKQSWSLGCKERLCWRLCYVALRTPSNASGRPSCTNCLLSHAALAHTRTEAHTHTRMCELTQNRGLNTAGLSSSLPVYFTSFHSLTLRPFVRDTNTRPLVPLYTPLSGQELTRSSESSDLSLELRTFCYRKFPANGGRLLIWILSFYYPSFNHCSSFGLSKWTGNPELNINPKK